MAHTVVVSGVTLGYRDADSLAESRAAGTPTSSCVRPTPARRTTSLLLLLTQLLEVRPDDSRVELEANAAKVVKGDRDELNPAAGSLTPWLGLRPSGPDYSSAKIFEWAD